MSRCFEASRTTSLALLAHTLAPVAASLRPHLRSSAEAVAARAVPGDRNSNPRSRMVHRDWRLLASGLAGMARVVPLEAKLASRWLQGRRCRA